MSLFHRFGGWIRLLLVTILPVAIHGVVGSDSQDGPPGRPVVDLKAPPMGCMSWERFRCTTDCARYPHSCINEDLYRTTADAMVAKGLAKAGYTQVSIDDCWVDKAKGRDPATHKLRPDQSRFPSGMKALGDYLHERGLQFGIYSDAGTKTCGGYEGSFGHAEIDATTFVEWGVDYVKLDGCYVGDKINDEGADFAGAYTDFGNALKKVANQRPIIYSCSWPAYIGKDESKKPYTDMYNNAGCNLWRNFNDIDNSWNSLYGIILHWAHNWRALQQIPDGAFNDADMLLVGDDHKAPKPGMSILTPDQARVQMGFWAMIASPLIIGGDVRTMQQEFVDILINPHAIAINQDPSRRQADCVIGCDGRKQGARSTSSKPSDILVWSKSLQFGHSNALAFFNLNSNSTSTSIEFQYSLEGAVARCVDIWNGDPEEDLCGHGEGATTKLWHIQRIEDNSATQGGVTLLVQALNVAPTSQRILRIDYLCGDGAEDSIVR